MKGIIIVISIFIALLVSGFLLTRPKEEIVSEDLDTGFTRFQTEELMREIGYVQ